MSAFLIVNPDLVIDMETERRYTNESALEILINSAQTANANDLPILGRKFLSSAYAMLNHDSGELTMWEASPTTREDLVAVDVNNQVLEGLTDNKCFKYGGTVTTNCAQWALDTLTVGDFPAW